MGFETDHPPIVYLERRIKYYKKKITSAKRWVKMDYFIRNYGKKGIADISRMRISEYEARIKEYEKAIEILKAAK